MTAVKVFDSDGRLKLDTGGTHEASGITFSPSGLAIVTGTDVQTAIEELDAAVDGIASGDPWTVVTKTVDEDVASSTTEQSDDALLFPIAATAICLFEMFIIYTNAAGSAPDFKMRIIGPANARGSYHALGLTTTDAAGGSTTGDINTAPAAVTFGTGTMRRLIRVDGWAFTAGTSGNITLQWCQNSSNITPTRVEAGSFLRYRQIDP